MNVKMNLGIIKRNDAADLDKGASQKIHFKVLWPRNGHADSVGVKLRYIYLSTELG